MSQVVSKVSNEKRRKIIGMNSALAIGFGTPHQKSQEIPLPRGGLNKTVNGTAHRTATSSLPCAVVKGLATLGQGV